MADFKPRGLAKRLYEIFGDEDEQVSDKSDDAEEVKNASYESKPPKALPDDKQQLKE